MKKFTLGMAAGAGTLALAVPLFAQLSFAAEDSSPLKDRPVPSQACVQAMANEASVQLAHFDEMTAAHKADLQAHQKALAAAGAIADDMQRQEALKAAHDAMRTDKALEKAVPADVQAAMNAVRAACGDTMKFRMKGHGGPGGPGMLGHKMMFKKERHAAPIGMEKGSSSSNTQTQ